MADANARPRPAPPGATAPVQRPRLAASLILTRARQNGSVEILFGRRSGGHVFMPQKYVFPGGRVDRTDGYAPLAREVREEVQAVLTRVLSERRARAAAAAALRETAEETGLLLARPGTIERPRPAWKPFADAGVKPDAAALDLVARAITPPGRTRRFDAWFFRADADQVHGEASLSGNGELEDLRWVALDQARHLDIPIITRFVLSELEAHLDGKRAPVRCARVTSKGPRVDEV
ncbi:NUDIX hydrolase [Alkalicaulis satelles]|uniref:NUDIX hydrolase n=1 Tax=Alkalicaulis satelles TaxID=2609175 RepID=A0A5M6ZAG4_9PROT|nr:NUDIX hydrolase [Alkalicaulis satelles]KAA5801699.1 NUDIX hydrolase [Alkalicaulis satelles]